MADLYSMRVVPFSGAHEEQSTSCSVCGKRSAVTRFAVPEAGFNLVECVDCHTAWQYPLPSIAKLTTYYPSEYYGDAGRKFAKSIERLLDLIGGRQARFIARSIPQGGAVLDVGCGRGVLLRRLQRLGVPAVGTEFEETAVRGSDFGGEVRIAATLRSADFAAESFDCVVIWHVLEHLLDPHETIREAFRILRPGGLLIVAVPNFASWQSRVTGRHWFHLDPPRHVFHFSCEGLKSLIQRAGFQYASEHHFSLRQNPYGWIQSVLDATYPTQRNRLYVMLHNARERPGVRERLRTLHHFVLAAALAPLAVVASIGEALAKRGGTVHVVAKKPRH